MTRKAQEIAGYISAAFEPIKKIIQDFHVGDFFKAGEDVSDLVISIFNFISKAISEVNWEKLGENVGNFLAGVKWGEILKSVGVAIGNALQGVISIWKGSFSVAPFETAIVTAFGLLKFTGIGKKITTNISKQLTSWFQSRSVLQKLSLAAGTLSIGMGLSILIDNLEDVKMGKDVANDISWETPMPLLVKVRNALA